MFQRSNFKIVVAYDNLETAIRVKALVDRVAVEIRPACELKCEYWRFDLLCHVEFASAAAADALAADMIIVAPRDNAELGCEVKAWIENWIPLKMGSHSALVALLEPNGDGRTKDLPPVCGYLRKVANRAGMDFLSHAP